MKTPRVVRVVGVVALVAGPMSVAAGVLLWMAARAPFTVMVPMDDGVRLATSVYLPGGDGPSPALLVRTPYNRREYEHLLSKTTARGVALVTQDTRGRYDSEGTDPAFTTDAADGQATLRWVAGQAWSNGAVGTYGESAVGVTQYLMAPGAPEALRCQWVEFAFPDLYRYKVFPGGLYHQGLAERWLEAQGNLTLLQTWRQHPLFDDYWAAASITERYRQIHVPAVHVGGWFDTFTLGTLAAFTGYQMQGGHGASGQQHLIMGPWTHGLWFNPRQGDLTFPDNAVLDLDRMLSQWIEWCLLGADGGVEAWPAVRYYVMGDVDDPAAPGNEWRTAAAWPVPAVETAFYLDDEGALSTAQPAADGEDTIIHNPSDPTPTIGGGNIYLPNGPRDQRPLEAHDDVLVYTTPPLEAPLEVTGVIRARLWLASDAPDTDVIVRLTDVYPDGRVMLLTDGGLRARFRDRDYTREAFMNPGTPYELRFDIGATSIAFNTGHRIRILVASSNAPRFEPNPGLPAPLWSGGWLTAGHPAHNAILRGPSHPSALLLPVVQE